MEAWQEKVRAEAKASGRRSTIFSFSFLISYSLIFVGAFIYVYLANQKDITRFGMTWAFICMLVMWIMDILAGLFSIAGVAREIVNDCLISLSLTLLVFAMILNFVVILALPSEDAMGEPSGLLPQDKYPPRCYYHIRSGRSDSNDCLKLRNLATYIWCLFIPFFIRIIIMISTRFSISYAKNGLVYSTYMDAPPPTYVIAPNPYQYRYAYPGNGQYVMHQSPPQYVVVAQQQPTKYTYASRPTKQSNNKQEQE